MLERRYCLLEFVRLVETEAEQVIQLCGTRSEAESGMKGLLGANELLVFPEPVAEVDPGLGVRVGLEAASPGQEVRSRGRVRWRIALGGPPGPGTGRGGLAIRRAKAHGDPPRGCGTRTSQEEFRESPEAKIPNGKAQEQEISRSVGKGLACLDNTNLVIGEVEVAAGKRYFGHVATHAIRGRRWACSCSAGARRFCRGSMACEAP